MSETLKELESEWKERDTMQPYTSGIHKDEANYLLNNYKKQIAKSKDLFNEKKRLEKENEELKDIIGDLITFKKGTSFYDDAVNRYKEKSE